MDTSHQQVDALLDKIAEDQTTLEFLEATWVSVLNAHKLTMLLDGHADDMLDVKRGERDDVGGITLRFRPDSIELTQWMISQLWTALKDIERRLSIRINATIAEAELRESRASVRGGR